MEWLKNFFKDINLKSFMLMLVEALVFIGILFGVSTCYGNENKTLDQNLKACRDTIEVLELKNGNLLYEKDAYILEKKELEEVLDISKKEIKDLEKKLNASIAQITKLEANVKIDTIVIENTKIQYLTPDSMQIKFKYNDEYISLDGVTEIIDSLANTVVYNITIPVPLNIGFTKDFKVFVESENPYVVITDLNSAILANVSNKKIKHWNIGIQAGLGAQYGLVNKNIDVGPYIGVGIAYGFGF